jgi:hypothetical protein
MPLSLIMSNALTSLSVEQLKRAVEIKEQIDSLQNELDALMSETPRVGRPRGPGRPRLGRPPGRGKMSAAARAAISAAQKARWAAQRGETPASGAGNGRRKRHVSAEARARISEAAKARWAKRKSQGKNTL